MSHGASHEVAFNFFTGDNTVIQYVGQVAHQEFETQQSEGSCMTQQQEAPNQEREVSQFMCPVEFDPTD
jgi:hypothetical protein